MKNWNKILLWAHFLVGLTISGYFFLLPAEGYSSTVNNIYKFGVVTFVFWTGIIRWNLPRIRRWMKKRNSATS